MSADPYKQNLFTANPYYRKAEVSGRLVAVLDGRMENRGLVLIPQPSRCLNRYQVHELILTDQQGIQAGGRVDRIAYLGFFSVAREGVVVAGDAVYLRDACIGKLLGFDETHMPNHLNIVILTENLKTGREIEAQPGDAIRFVMAAGGN
ncbi:MAG: hypothetical protein N2491_01510 [Negativicutes bacterium]|nr:hypothetical protein [Negativicutes bacterium]